MFMFYNFCRPHLTLRQGKVPHAGHGRRRR
jgi:hypothetical protein